MHILILGSGAREHALACKLRQSSLVKQIFVGPGNGGTQGHFTNLKIDLTDFEAVAEAVVHHDIKLVIVGPEQPLVNGITDFLENHPSPAVSSTPVVGPNQACAQLEGSKEFSKQIMEEAGIPTAKAVCFGSADWERCRHYIENHALPVVIKADGLASGKGVAVCHSHTEALQFASRILQEEAFGAHNASLLVEDFLQGIEVSMFLLSDGVHYQLLPEAKDYKRIYDGDLGPNTGGMGAVSPVPFVDADFVSKVEERIIKPLFKTLLSRQLYYKGFLFIGLMNDDGEPYVVEFNTRLGDPETETILQRMEGDLVPALLSLRSQTLNLHPIAIAENAAATVVVCAENYPETPATGDLLQLPLGSINEVQFFHAGTIYQHQTLKTSGGRVVACTAVAENLAMALEKVYQGVQQVSFRGMQFRKDIGQDILAWQARL